MKSRKKLLKKSQLYLILNKPSFSKRSLKKIDSVLASGKISLLQLRNKQSSKQKVLDSAIKISKLLKNRALLIINDYVDIAFVCRADGVHLGQGDLSLKQARSILGKDKIIGVSCHNLAQALKAQRDGADYIGIGPVFKTATKPESKAIGLKALKELKNKIKIPYFAIGGIDEKNINKVIASYARRIAVCQAILQAKNPKKSARQLWQKLN